MTSNNRNKLEKLLKETQELLKFESQDDKATFLSLTTQLDFLSEIQKVLDNKGWSHTDLAKKLGVSKSFISQLFSGDKSFFNSNFIGKLQCVLNQKISIQFNYNYSTNVIDLSAVDNRLIENFKSPNILQKEYAQDVRYQVPFDFTPSEYTIPS